MINGFNNAPSEFAKLLSGLGFPTVPLSSTANSLPSSRVNAQDVLELSSPSLKHSVAEQRDAILTQLADLVSDQQNLDVVLSRIEKALGRMLELAELAKNPEIPPQQRARYAIEFTRLQQYVSDMDRAGAGDSNVRNASQPVSSQWLYGVPVESMLRGLADKIEENFKQLRKRQSFKKYGPRFPKVVILVCAWDLQELLGDTIESILRQQYTDLKCLLISGDSSVIEYVPELYRDRIAFFRLVRSACNTEVLKKVAAQESAEITGMIFAGDRIYPHALQTIGSLFLMNPEVNWTGGRSSVIRGSQIDVASYLDTHFEMERRTSGSGNFTDLRSTFWRPSAFEAKANAGIGMEGRNLTPLRRVDRFLIGLGKLSDTLHANSVVSSVDQPSKGLAKNDGPAPDPQAGFIESLDAHPIDCDMSVDQLVFDLKGALGKKNYPWAFELAGKIAAADPSNPDCFGMEAVCAFLCGRVIEAQSIMHNLAIAHPNWKPS